MKGEYKIALHFIPVGVMLVVGLALWVSIDENMDYEFIHNQIATNQTFVDNMSCAKINLTDRTLENMISLVKQDQIDILKEDFKKLKSEKCEAEK